MAYPEPPQPTLDDVLAAKVAAAVERAMAPFMERLAKPLPLTYTVPEAAALVGVSRSTMDRWVKSGAIPVVPFTEGSVRRIARVTLERFVSGEGLTIVDGAA